MSWGDRDPTSAGAGYTRAWRARRKRGQVRFPVIADDELRRGLIDAGFLPATSSTSALELTRATTLALNKLVGRLQRSR